MGEQAQPPAAFATVEDLVAGWHALTDEQQKKATILLARASRKIRATCPQWKRYEQQEHGICADICCAMVQRAMTADETGMPAGASQVSETTGPFSNGVTFTNPLGDLYLLDSEKKALGVGVQQKAFRITLGRS